MSDFVDQLHHDCLVAQAGIRSRYRVLRQLAATWEPAPMPETFGTPWWEEE